MRVLSAILTALFTCTAAFAVELGEDVARVCVVDQRAHGTGFLIGSDGDVGYVLTAAHVIEDCGSSQIIVDFPAETRLAFKAQALVVREDVDLAVLTIQAPAIRPRRISWRSEIEGCQVRLAGFGGLGAAVSHGRVVAVHRNHITVTVNARLGDSGGPICDVDGQAVGVLVGRGIHDGLGYATQLSPQRDWLEDVIPEKSIVVRRW